MPNTCCITLGRYMLPPALEACLKMICRRGGGSEGRGWGSL